MSVKDYGMPKEEMDWGAPDERVPPELKNQKATKCLASHHRGEAYKACSRKRQRELDELDSMSTEESDKEDDDAFTLKHKKEEAAKRKFRRLLKRHKRELDELISMPEGKRKENDQVKLCKKQLKELQAALDF